MPNEFPYFPLYVNDFVADGKVEAMTTLEVGAYFLLLCKAWAEQPRGSIPNNDMILARWTRMAPEQWTECKPGVLNCFTLQADNRWHQKRMEFEARKLRDLASTRSRAGKKGAARKWSKSDDDDDGKANGRAMANADLCHDFANGKTMASDSDSNSESESALPLNGNGGLGEGEGFAQFWKAYPLHANKKKAAEAWNKLRPDPRLFAAILAAIERQKRGRGWKEGFIPHASTWLNGHRWEDEITEHQKSIHVPKSNPGQVYVEPAGPSFDETG